jgi:ABC-type phosphate transport system substrate-binding protein
MRRARSTIIIPTVMALFLCFAWGHSAAEDKKVVRITGGGALSDAIQSYLDLYVKDAPNCSITVTGTTTGTGSRKLFDGEADMVMATRKITAEESRTAAEKGLSLTSTNIG